MRIAKSVAAGLTGLVVVAAMAAGSGEALAKGGGTGGGGGGGGATPTPTTATCGTLTVTPGSQLVSNPNNMPALKYAVTDCGTQALKATVTITEAPTYFTATCPSPTAPPASVALPAGGKLAGSAPVFRGPCGVVANGNFTPVQGTQAWQGHQLTLTLTDDASGAVLSTGTFGWQDAPRQTHG